MNQTTSLNLHIYTNQNTRVYTSSKIAGRAFSKVEYAKDTPVRLGKGVLDVSESKAREDPVSTILDIVALCKVFGIHSCSLIWEDKIEGQISYLL